MDSNNLDDSVVDYGDSTLNDTENQILSVFDDPPAPAPEPEPEPEPKGDDTVTPETDSEEEELTRNADGALVRKDGTIVAEAGKERREFVQQKREERATRQLAAAREELTQLRSTVEQLQKSNTLAQQYNLQPSELQAGMQIMSEFRNNPVAVAQWALKETLAMGYNLKQIVGEGDASVEMQAIRKMIDERVGPVVDQQRATSQEQEQRQAALRQYNEFMQKHEHADVHEDALASLMQKEPGLSADAAYWRLREFASRMQLDFAQPLGPQLRTKMERQQQPQTQSAPASAPPRQQQVQQPAMAPMPNGASPNTPVQSAQQMFADPSSDWDAIVADSMRAAGMQ